MSTLPNQLSPDEVALEAYLYYYPLVMMEFTRQQLCANAIARGLDLAASPFIHNRNVANAKWRSVARTNVDTLFSSCWLDMANGPAVMSIPGAESRFFMYQILDMWSDTFAVFGSRTLGDRAVTVRFVSTGAGGSGDLGANTADGTALVPTPTRFSWIIGRTYTSNAQEDLERARQHQIGVDIVYGQTPRAIDDVEPSMRGESPVEMVDSLDAQKFFERADSLHKREGAHATDWSVLLRLPTVGLATGKSFRFDQQSAAVQRSLVAAVTAGKELTKDLDAVSTSSDGWQQFHSGIGVYGNDYLRRAIVARYGLAANPREDAVYISTSQDARGLSLRGDRHYILRFEPGMLPTAKYFWSVTAYDHEGQLMNNQWQKFSVSSRDPLRYESDGSLVVSVGPTPSMTTADTNWIPTNATTITLTLRMYGPSAEVLAGRWMPPAVVQELGAR